MPDTAFTKQQILDFDGSVEIFCPAVNHKKSEYKRVGDVALFAQNAFESWFRPVGRIMGKRMLICLLPAESRHVTGVRDEG